MVALEQGQYKPRNMSVAIANLAAALAEVTEEYNHGSEMEWSDWSAMRAARESLIEAITQLRPYGTGGERAQGPGRQTS